MEGSLPSGNSVISKEEIFITKDLRYEKFVQKSESVQSCYRVAIVARRKMVPYGTVQLLPQVQGGSLLWTFVSEGGMENAREGLWQIKTFKESQLCAA